MYLYMYYESSSLFYTVYLQKKDKCELECTFFVIKQCDNQRYQLSFAESLLKSSIKQNLSLF